jgi:hypothetical protein
MAEHGIELNPKGKMYEVSINADPEHFLDWDKPLSEQSEHVRNALAQAGITSGMTGREIYSEELPLLTGKYNQTDRLRDAGIPGIKYLDQGSRGAGEGTHNYVLFDDKTVNILRKYGLAGLLSGAAADAAFQGKEQP